MVEIRTGGDGIFKPSDLVFAVCWDTDISLCMPRLLSLCEK
jgi:hypothetical protein